MGRETDLPSTGRKRMEEEGEKERKKKKPGVILASKRKSQKVKSVLGFVFAFSSRCGRGVLSLAQRDA